MYKHILFDLDGTLTDSRLGITQSVWHALKVLGYEPPSVAELTWVVGPPLRASFAALAKTNDLAVVNRLLAEYRKRFEPIGMFENDVYPDIPEVLEILKEHGYSLFVATSKPRVYAEKILTHFGLRRFFDVVDGAELDGSIETKADVIRHLLDNARLAPQDCIMVGDREHDVLGARANGIQTLGVTYGFGSPHELTNAGAKALVDRPMDILRALEA